MATGAEYFSVHWAIFIEAAPCTRHFWASDCWARVREYPPKTYQSQINKAARLMKTSNIYLDLFVVFAPLSLISVGGGQSVVGDMHLQAVDIYHWLTHAQFIDLFAISRAALGPGALLATLIGWQVSGWQGALVASLALFGPSTILAYFVTRAWHKSHDRPWTAVVQNALAPLASGLLLTSAIIILRSTSGGVTPWLIAAVSAGIFWRFKTINPMPVLCLGGLVLVFARL